MTGDPRYAYAEVRVTRTYRVRVDLSSKAAQELSACYGGPGGAVAAALEGFELDALNPAEDPRTGVKVLAEDGPLRANNWMHRPDERPFVVLVEAPRCARVPAARNDEIRAIFRAHGCEVFSTWNNSSNRMSVNVGAHITDEQRDAINSDMEAIEPLRAWDERDYRQDDVRATFADSHVLEVSHG